jgi:hypothetical protein
VAAKTAEPGPETKGRVTLYKGIRMRSRLEADYAAHLDRHAPHGESWEYEPICFGSDAGQWLPDFRVTWTHPEGKTARYVEVKPVQLIQKSPTMPATVELVDKLLTQMSVVWDSEPAAGLMLSFHGYGQEWPEFEVFGFPGAPWMCVENLAPWPKPLIWPGMGQEAALPFAPDSARARRTASAR